MKVLIDTSSFLSLVRYYSPFDEKSVLLEFFKGKIESKEFILLDQIFEECKFVGKSIVVNTLPFLTDKLNHTKTSDLFPNQKFFNLMEHQFMRKSWVKTRALDAQELEALKSQFLKSPDAKLILYALKHRPDVCIVSEETESANDQKAFHKIPHISNSIDIECITLPKLIKRHNIAPTWKSKK